MRNQWELERRKGVSEWKTAIEEAGVELPKFSDVLVGKEAPKDFGEPIARDVDLDGIMCDIYHSINGPGHTLHRVFIHRKG